MSVSLDHVMTVLPLRKPHAKLRAKRRADLTDGRESQIKDVLAKIEDADDRKTYLLPSPGYTKGGNENRLLVSCLKGYVRESPGM